MDEFTSTENRKAVTITGLTPVVHDISDAIYKELVDRMLPISGVLVCLAMLYCIATQKSSSSVVPQL